MSPTERGAALAVTLILLGGLGSLALTAAAAAVAALAVAGHQQYSQQAFEAAEAGIAHALILAAQSRSGGVIPETPHQADAAWPTAFEARTGAAAMPGALPVGFSIGEHGGAFAAQHYFIVANGRATRGAQARIEQGFYLVIPGGGT